MVVHLHSVIVSYKRRELTEECLRSWRATVSVPHSLVIVDNGSPPDVTEWLQSLDVPVILLGQNYFPGYAINRGWEQMPPETTHLQRCDNDVRYLSGWCEATLAAFKDPAVMQVGLTAEGDEEWTQMASWPVGGNSVIRRSGYDEGLRYSELPWTADHQEDHHFTKQVWERGYQRAFTTPCIEYLDANDGKALNYKGADEYRNETRQVRARATVDR